jgi:hypothetical protein
MTERILLCSAPLKRHQRVWAESQTKTLLDKFKKQKDTNIFIYSSLSNEYDINMCLYAQSLQLPVVGCLLHEYYSNDFKPIIKTKLNAVRRNLYFTKIIGKKPNYETYRKQTLYLLSQTNNAICVWDKEEDTFFPFWISLESNWKGKKNVVYHVNYRQFETTNFMV